MDVVQKESATPETAFGTYTPFFNKLLNPNFCEYMPKGMPFKIEETNKDGKAVITITPEFPCFAVRNLDDKAQITKMTFLHESHKGDGNKYKAVSKCADDAVFLFVDGNWILHIFEFKKSQSTIDWDEVKYQFSGGVVRAYVIAGVLRIPEFSDVHLHFCYRKNKSSPATLKTLPGKPAPKNYLKAPITLDSYPELAVKNAPVELNQDGYADIRLHERGVTRN